MDSSPAPSALTDESGTVAAGATTEPAAPAHGFPHLAWTGKAVIANLAGRMIPGRNLTPDEVAHWFGHAKAVALAIERGYYAIVELATELADALATEPAATEPAVIDPATGEPMTLAPVDAMAADPSAQEDHANA